MNVGIEQTDDLPSLYRRAVNNLNAIVRRSKNPAIRSWAAMGALDLQRLIELDSRLSQRQSAAASSPSGHSSVTPDEQRQMKEMERFLRSLGFEQDPEHPEDTWVLSYMRIMIAPEIHSSRTYSRFKKWRRITTNYPWWCFMRTRNESHSGMGVQELRNLLETLPDFRGMPSSN